jgi:DNA topoisomerase VI subunit B
MDPTTYLFSFHDVSLAEANRLIADLEEELRRADPRLVATRKRADARTQDAGALLEVALQAASVAALAKGIASFIGRSSGARIEIRRPDGTAVMASRLDSRDASRIAEALIKY